MAKKVKRLKKIDGDTSESAVESSSSDSNSGVEVSPSKLPKLSKRSKQLSKAVEGIDDFQLWSSIPPLMVCPTRFTSFNRASKCGGIPGGMLGILHGPSQGGKTVFLAEILYDAWVTGGWGLFVDAECRAVDIKWFSTICSSLDEIAYVKPKTYEACIKGIEKYRAKFRKAKDKGDLPPGAFLAIGIDSINRLTPSNELKELLEGKVGARGYPLRALLTSKWLDKILPTLERDEILVFILREGVKLDAMENQKKYIVKGGNAPIYDAGWICRVTSVAKVKKEVAKADKEDDDGKKKKKKRVLIGEKHELEVIKNSLGPHLDEAAFFYTSVGESKSTPLGLDFAREVREESLLRKIVKQVTGNGYFYKGEKIANNKIEYLNWLKEVNDDGELNWSMLSTELNSEFTDE
jgi:RecA/RadA recombinase